MARLIEIGLMEVAETVKHLNNAGLEPEVFKQIRQPGGAERAVAALQREFSAHETLEIGSRAHLLFEESVAGAGGARSFALSVDEQLHRFRAANAAGGWGFGEEVFGRLAASAPEWPDGDLVVRSLRIRMGTGDEGVAKTFEAHAEEVKRVFGEDHYYRLELLLSGTHPFKGKRKLVDRLWLLAGNHTHKPSAEWIIADLGTHRSRRSISAVRDPKTSLADELLVVAWMFPDLIQSINSDTIPGQRIQPDTIPGFFAAGYELNVPPSFFGPGQDVPIVDWNRGYRRVELFAVYHDDDDYAYSVPSLREC